MKERELEKIRYFAIKYNNTTVNNSYPIYKIKTYSQNIYPIEKFYRDRVGIKGNAP